MNILEHKLGDLYLENSRNGIYKSPEFQGRGVKLIKMNQQFGHRFIDDRLPNIELLELTDDELSRFELKENDLLFSRTSVVPEGVGMCSIVRAISEPLAFESNIIRVRLDPNKSNPEFIFRYFQSHSGRGKILAIAGGTNIKTIKGSSLKEISLPLPLRAIQDSAVDSLRNYDNLIENNHRRIRLLEESARLLYQEWFVHLRFPGHEHIAITDGIPEGWKKTSLGQYSKLNYGKALKAENRIEGNFAVYGSSGVVGSHNAGLVKGPTIIVGRKGNVGSVYWSSRDCWPIDTVYFIDPDKANLYLYYALQFMQFINTDVAVPGLNRDMAHSRPLMIPSPRILNEFLLTAAPIRQQIEKLEKLNQKLAQARDLLLPRLMNGEMTV